MKQERFKNIILSNGRRYTFDTYIFLSYIFALLFFFIAIMLLNGGLQQINNFYVTCNNSIGTTYTYLDGTHTVTDCENPLYNTKYCRYAWATACEDKYIPNGFVYGTPPPKYFAMFNTITILLLLTAFILNHVIYNMEALK